MPHGISGYKILTAIPIFSGSGFLIVALSMSRNVNVWYKSKMAAKLPDVLITLLVLQIHTPFQKQYRVYDGDVGGGGSHTTSGRSAAVIIDRR